jgi:hypothetical protein
MTSSSYDIFLQQGSDYSINLNLTNSDTSPIDLSAYNVSGIAKMKYSDTGILLNLSPSIINAPSGIINIFISGIKTETLPINIGFYDIFIYNSGSVTSVLNGKVFINPSITF